MASFEDPLPIDGFKGTPDEIEQQWLEQVYRGRGDCTAQLTLRAVLMGAALGSVLSLTNLYIGLKAGWSIGVAITACIASYTLWSLFLKAGLAKTPMTILENNCMQSTADSAGYGTAPILVSAFPAYFMLNDRMLPISLMIAWVGLLAVLGVTMAIPMKRQILNIEQLRFPTGVATAETLRALYARGKKATLAARALTIGGIVAAIFNFWANGFELISASLGRFGLDNLTLKLSNLVLGPEWTSRTIVFTFDPVFIGTGVLMGIRPAASMILGGTLCWGVFVPILQHHGIITGVGYKNIVPWTLWAGTSCMVVSGLLSFAFQWRSIGRAFGSLRSALSRKPGKVSELDQIETPVSWFFIGQIVCVVALIWVAKRTMDLPAWETIVAVALSFLLALIACRVTGETDTTPGGAMGKLTQITFGALNPGNMNINLLSAGITSSVALSSADLLTDLKSGYLLGANPRKQFLAQIIGCFVGTASSVLAFRVMVPTVSALGTDQFPAPAAQTWRAVALALSKGFEALEPIKIWSIVIGALVGAILALIPKLFPKAAPWTPSPAAIGLSWTFHWFYSMLFFTGGFLDWIVRRKSPATAEQYNYPVGAGLIAGGSLMGVALIFWQNFPLVYHQLFAH